jgi:RNA polymerase sigma factor (sigma-70 family)
MALEAILYLLENTDMKKNNREGSKKSRNASTQSRNRKPPPLAEQGVTSDLEEEGDCEEPPDRVEPDDQAGLLGKLISELSNESERLTIRYPILDEDSQRHILQLIQNPEVGAAEKRRALERLARYVIRLIRPCAIDLLIKSELLSKEDFKDLIQEGASRVIAGVSTFQRRQSSSFASFARVVARKNMRRFVDVKVRNIRIPVNKERELRALRRTIASLRSELGQEPTFDQLAWRMGMKKEDIQELLTLEYTEGTTVSLDAPVNPLDEEPAELLDLCVDKRARADILAEENENKRILRECLNRLPQIECAVLEFRYAQYPARERWRLRPSLGMKKIQKLRRKLRLQTALSMQETADVLNIPKSTVEQIEKRALAKLERQGPGAIRSHA